MRTIALAAAMAAFAFPVMASEVFGTWKSKPSDTGAYIHVDVGPCPVDDSLVCGRISETFNTNPERDSIVGRLIIENMQAESPTEWEGGTIWAPDEDETYASEMELKGDVLEVSGCVLGGLICRGQDWTRVQ